jgi:hypothetical protein
VHLLQAQDITQEPTQLVTEEPALPATLPSEALPEDVILEDAAPSAVEPVAEDTSLPIEPQKLQAAALEDEKSEPAMFEAEAADGSAVLEGAAVHQDQDPATSAGARQNHRCLLLSAALYACIEHITVVLSSVSGKCASLHCLLHDMRQLQHHSAFWTCSGSGSVGVRLCALVSAAVCTEIGFSKSQAGHMCMDQFRWDFSRILRGWRVSNDEVQEACNGPCNALTKHLQLWCLCMKSIQKRWCKQHGAQVGRGQSGAMCTNYHKVESTGSSAVILHLKDSTAAETVPY